MENEKMNINGDAIVSGILETNDLKVKNGIHALDYVEINGDLILSGSNINTKIPVLESSLINSISNEKIDEKLVKLIIKKNDNSEISTTFSIDVKENHSSLVNSISFQNIDDYNRRLTIGMKDDSRLHASFDIGKNVDSNLVAGVSSSQNNNDFVDFYLQMKDNSILSTQIPFIQGPKGDDGNPVGTIIKSFQEDTPSGYLYANGEYVVIDEYPDLFQKLTGINPSETQLTKFVLPFIPDEESNIKKRILKDISLVRNYEHPNNNNDTDYSVKNIFVRSEDDGYSHLYSISGNLLIRHRFNFEKGEIKSFEFVCEYVTDPIECFSVLEDYIYLGVTNRIVRLKINNDSFEKLAEKSVDNEGNVNAILVRKESNGNTYVYCDGIQIILKRYLINSSGNFEEISQYDKTRDPFKQTSQIVATDNESYIFVVFGNNIHRVQIQNDGTFSDNSKQNSVSDDITHVIVDNDIYVAYKNSSNIVVYNEDFNEIILQNNHGLSDHVSIFDTFIDEDENGDSYRFYVLGTNEPKIYVGKRTDIFADINIFSSLNVDSTHNFTSIFRYDSLVFTGMENDTRRIMFIYDIKENVTYKIKSYIRSS